ncbi:MAG: CHAP domain-containing protein [Acetobacteraceae bacterium]
MGRHAGFRKFDLLAALLAFPLLLAGPAAALAGPAALRAPTPARPRAALHRIRFYFVSCVPYARQRSGISLPGNAWQWWGNAAGRYVRGHTPGYGAVMVFRPIGRMPLGHVAVVSRIVNAREILVDQANWVPAGQIRVGVPVVDVSPENDWSEVRVGIGRDHFGSTTYPVYGFIYRTQRGEVPTEVARALPLPPMSPADLGIAATGSSASAVEIAEAPHFSPGSSLLSGQLRLDAPAHRLQ